MDEKIKILICVDRDVHKIEKQISESLRKPTSSNLDKKIIEVIVRADELPEVIKHLQMMGVYLSE